MRSRRSYTPTRPGAEDARPKREKTPDEQRDDLLAYAFRALGQRALSATELRGKLERRSDNPELIAQVLARVQELGYQQDEQVARIETSRRGLGQFRVRQNLKRRGLNAELIDETIQAIEPEDERQEAAELLSRRWDSMLRKRDPRAAAYALLARRGYPSPVIWAAIREVLDTRGETEELSHLAEPEDG